MTSLYTVKLTAKGRDIIDAFAADKACVTLPGRPKLSMTFKLPEQYTDFSELCFMLEEAYDRGKRAKEEEIQRVLGL